MVCLIVGLFCSFPLFVSTASVVVLLFLFWRVVVFGACCLSVVLRFGGYCLCVGWRCTCIFVRVYAHVCLSRFLVCCYVCLVCLACSCYVFVVCVLDVLFSVVLQVVVVCTSYCYVPLLRLLTCCWRVRVSFSGFLLVITIA